ncbi:MULTISPECIES: glycosyltransferase [Photobacterium]|uniref:Glycosyltransferase 2-like domain-containing protein n=1 Tax=Photobacterium angustum TaxID=661 RepID=A0ABX5H2J4_PHOAN|nr:MULTISPECIES: glycosyltransferase [Photobacterium]PSV39782.1 hypothetical protein C9J38_04415 [Photobacterium sp. GB-210]PSX07459.1 hypothetical protein C0W27_15680 [Photobacterium angustum]
MKPKLSILTINFNDSKGLERTLSSIDNFLKCFNLELVVIDGGSTDESASIIDNYQDLITYTVSEKDDGIYDAMNKGLEYCTGDYVLFLNSGDYFNGIGDVNVLFDTIDKVSPKVIFWPAKINSETSFWFYPPEGATDEYIRKWFDSNLPNHQAMLFPKQFYSLNKYDRKMVINSDADYKLRAIKQYGTYFIPFSLTTFELGGVSSQTLSWKSYKIRIKDVLIFEEKHNRGLNKYYSISSSVLKYTIKLIASNILPSDLYIKLLKSSKDK